MFADIPDIMVLCFCQRSVHESIKSYFINSWTHRMYFGCQALKQSHDPLSQDVEQVCRNTGSQTADSVCCYGF